MKKKLLALLMLMSIGNLSGSIELKNSFLKVIGYAPSGRFIIKTTGGDPGLTTDKDTLLLYEDDPPTTFATIMIDKLPYRFGGELGRFNVPLQVKDNILTATWTINKIEVTQLLEFVQGPTTGRMDSVKISYIVINRDTRDHIIGLRLLLDTFLGKNDGASFRIPGEGNIATETVFENGNVPDYWYAFNDLGNPGVRAQSLLRSKGLAPPDMIMFASWARFNENSWDFPVKQGRTFRRLILGSLDSATAYFWQPQNLSGGQSRRFSTLYGIYGESPSRDDVFAVSLSGPVSTKGEPVVITADIQKTIVGTVRDVKAKLILPVELKMSGMESQTRDLTDISLNSAIAHVKWIVVPDSSLTNYADYKVIVKGKINGRMETSSVSRRLSIRHSRAMAKLQKEGRDPALNALKGSSVSLEQINDSLGSIDTSLGSMNGMLNELNGLLENNSPYDRRTEYRHAAERKVLKGKMAELDAAARPAEKDPAGVRPVTNRAPSAYR